jgi:hypothetical protein
LPEEHAPLGPEWIAHPRRDGFYVDEARPGWMRDRLGSWFADTEGTWWYRDDDGRIAWLEAPKEPSAAERQAQLEDPMQRIRARIRDLGRRER